MDNLVSVIMPVYNSERYILKSVLSVLNQTYVNFELIIINDGSTDNSPEILKTLNDPRVVLLNVPNGGPSKARNIGLQRARGMFIQFVDADDYLDENSTEQLVSMIKNYDMVVAGYRTIKEDDVQITTIDMLGTHTAETVARNYLKLLDLQYIKHLWNKLYLKNIIDEYSIKFDESLKRGEGIAFNLEYLKHVKRINFVNKVVYNHISDNSESITSNYLPTFIDNSNVVFDSIREYLSVYHLEEKHKMEIDQLYIRRMINYIRVVVKSDTTKNKEVKLEELNRIVSNTRFSKALQNYKPETNKRKVLKFLLKYKRVNLLYMYYSSIENK